MSLQMKLEKRLGDFRLNVSLTAGNETVALLGPSGCGKSKTLQCIAGIERPDLGSIQVDGIALFDAERRVDLPPQRRKTGLLFQNYALFPHMTLRENLLTGLHWERDKSSREQQCAQMLERLDLGPLRDLYPRQLSGGQQQRGALGRILLSRPRILLLDEPFSALDSHLRFQMEGELRTILRDFEGTVLLVTHDGGEAQRLSQSVALYGPGVIDRLGATETVFRRPETVNEARLTGWRNISPLRHAGEGKVLALDWDILLPAAPIPPDCAAIALREESLHLGGEQGGIPCKVTEALPQGESTLLALQPEGSRGKIWLSERETQRRQVREQVLLTIPQEAILTLRN